MKTLIAYYSRAGHTAQAAKELQEIVGGDLFEIRGTKDYGNYVQALRISRKEFSSGELPEVVSDVEDFGSYDRVLLGFPIWFGKCPQLVVSFAASHDLSGKDVFPFCTSGSSGPEKAQAQLQEHCSGAALHKGMRLNEVDKDTVQAWLDSPTS